MRAGKLGVVALLSRLGAICVERAPAQVADPVLSLSGASPAQQTVAVTVSESTPEALLYYTTNGSVPAPSNPDSAALVPGSSVRLDRNQTLQVRAFLGASVSNLVSTTFATSGQLAVGGGHALALRPDGSLWAWGDNSSGQLGDGLAVAESPPLALSMPGILPVTGMTVTTLTADHDGNGLADAWEWQYFGQTGLDPASDPSRSGLTLLQKFQLGLDPLVSSTAGDGVTDGWKVAHGFDPHLRASTAGDGLPDSWKAQYHLDIGSWLAWQDPDGDGLTNLQEFLLGTDPLQADSDHDGYDDLTEVRLGSNPLNASSVPLATVSVAAQVATVREDSPMPATFWISRSPEVPFVRDLTVHFALSGVAVNGEDYGTVSSQVTIPAGQASAVVEIVPVADDLTEPDESVVLTLAEDPVAYLVGDSASASLLIEDPLIVPVEIRSLRMGGQRCGAGHGSGWPARLAGARPGDRSRPGRHRWRRLVRWL